MKKKRIIINIFIVLLLIASILGLSYIFINQIDINNLLTIEFGIFSVCLLGLIISASSIISMISNGKYRNIEKSLNNRLAMWNSISYKVKKAGETAFNNLPIGIIIISEKLKVLWSNSESKKIFESTLENIDLKNISVELYDDLINYLKTDKQDGFDTKIYGEIYHVDFIREHSIIYLTKITAYFNLINQYRNRTTALGYINIDNYEEALAEFDVQERAEYSGKIIGMVVKWFENYGAFVRAFTDNRYITIMDREQLETMMKTGFPIVDEIKSIMYNSKPLRVTLSIGICCLDENIEKVAADALDLLDLTFNRGGDQVAVKVDDKIEFYGAKQEAIPKDNKVDIRIKSEELQDLFLSSSKVFVMAHINTDTDGFGAALGLYKMAKALGKEAYIVQEDVDNTVKRINNDINVKYVELTDSIIKTRKAISMADDKSLLMIVDFQTANQSPDNYKNETDEFGAPSEKIIKKFKNIAIIDHHRKGNNAIENYKFYYSKTYSSSSVELIMELLEFWRKPVEFTPIEATWLLLGIIVDTNNFIYRANVKTFEVAAQLKKYGADMQSAQRYLKESIEDINTRSNFTRNVLITGPNNEIAIASSELDRKCNRAEIAKISDSLLDIDNVELGITIAYLDDDLVGVSSRSLGKLNAQTIMEKLGGGGHLNNAAAQVKGATIEEVKARIIKILDEVVTTKTKIKVVFKKDVKNKYHKYDIKEIYEDEAEKYISEDIAILATSENLQLLENQKNETAILLEQTTSELTALKEKLESKPIKISGIISENGKLKSPITSKQVIDKLEKEFDIKLNLRKFELEQTIDSLGTFVTPIVLDFKDSKIKLDKAIIANITIFVTEE